MNSNDSRIVAEGLSKTFISPAGTKVRALRDVSFSLSGGEWTVVVGHNGAGKTTLLRLIVGELVPDDGKLVIENNADAFRLGGTAETRQTGVRMVVQQPAQNIVLDFTVYENIALISMGAAMPSVFRLATRREETVKVMELLESIDLGDKAGALARELSVGQQQLLAIKLAVSQRSSWLLLDEPVASLDRENAQRCIDLVRDSMIKHSCGVLMVTHDLLQARNIADRLLILREGEVAADLRSCEASDLGLERLVELSTPGKTGQS